MVTNRFMVALVACSLSGPISMPAHGQTLPGLPGGSLPDIPVKVQIGLDEGTQAIMREFMKDFPVKVREQLVEAVNQSLDRVDRSFDEYITKIQKAAVETVEELSCTTNGTVENTMNGLTQGLTSLVWNKLTPLSLPPSTFPIRTPSKVDRDAEDLLNDVVQREAEIQSNTSPLSALAKYSDIIFRVAAITCRYNAMHTPFPLGKVLMTRLRKAAGEWQILSIMPNCATVGDCLIQRRDEIVHIIKSSNPEMIKEAELGDFDAEKLITTDGASIGVLHEIYRSFSRIVRPDPNANWYSDNVNAALLRIREAEMKIAWQRKNWQVLGGRSWENSRGAFDRIMLNQKRLDVLLDARPGTGFDYHEYPTHAFIALAIIKGLVPVAHDALSTAQRYDPRLKDAVAKAMIQLAAIEVRSAEQVDTDCGLYLTPRKWNRVIMLPNIDTGSSGYEWCLRHRSDRWAQFPTHE